MIKEEYISILSEPGSNFLDRIAVDRRTSQIITNAIQNFLSERNICTEQIKVAECDRTAVNTDAKGGIVRKLEDKFGRPLHWFVCQLHAIELPLRLDGKTTGSRGYSGNIGKAFENYEQLPVVEFMPIDSEMPLQSVTLFIQMIYCLCYPSLKS